MVEQRSSNDPTSGWNWLRGVLFGGAGLVAVVRYWRGQTPSGAPVHRPPSLEPRADGEEVIYYPDGRIEHPSVHFETRDVRFRAILFILLGAMGFAAFVHWVLLAFFFHYENYESAIKQSPYPLAREPSDRLPPEPRLEPLDRLHDITSSNVYVREESKETFLQRYGPSDERGYVHIPIGRAMQMIEGKLPVAKGAKREAEAADKDSGESNSGRRTGSRP